MRDKQEILKDLRSDILDEPYKDNAPLWLAYHTAEVFIDIRDVLSTTTNILISIRETLDHLP